MHEKTAEELNARLEELREANNQPEADVAAISEEIRAIATELNNRQIEEAKRAEIRKAVADGAGEEEPETKSEFKAKEKQKMTNEEIRSTQEYVDAFAKDIRRNDTNMTESRALLTELVSGTVPVPKIVEERIRTNWERLGLMSLVRKTFIPGVLRVGFELSATAATNHTESTTAVTEEDLTLGVVAINPVSVKKWISISDEALDLTSEEFLFYIYDEITYQIAKKAQKNLLDAIIACTASATAATVSVQSVTGTPSVGVIAEAIGTLSDDAADPVIVMNKGTWAQFKAAQYAGNFNVDPFEGLRVYYDNNLPAYTTSGTTGSTWAIVGDFGVGAHANFPAGEEITLKYDDTSLAEKDLVKIVGREYVGVAAVHCNAFAKIVF